MKCKSCANYQLGEGYRADFVCTEGLKLDDNLTECDGYSYLPGSDVSESTSEL